MTSEWNCIGQKLDQVRSIFFKRDETQNEHPSFSNIDEDTSSILTDNANRAIQGNVAMQVTQRGVTSASVANWWTTLEPMQVAQPDDQILNEYKRFQFSGCNT